MTTFLLHGRLILQLFQDFLFLGYMTQIKCDKHGDGYFHEMYLY